MVASSHTRGHEAPPRDRVQSRRGVTLRPPSDAACASSDPAVRHACTSSRRQRTFGERSRHSDVVHRSRAIAYLPIRRCPPSCAGSGADGDHRSAAASLDSGTRCARDRVCEVSGRSLPTSGANLRTCPCRYSPVPVRVVLSLIRWPATGTAGSSDTWRCPSRPTARASSQFNDASVAAELVKHRRWPVGRVRGTRAPT